MVWTFPGFRPLTGMVLNDFEMNFIWVGFRPLTGMVHKLLEVIVMWFGFRPLTGIVPDCVLTETMDGLFSPPYGDGTVSFDGYCERSWFSPPYGDGTS